MPYFAPASPQSAPRTGSSPGFRSWSTAMNEALYGQGGFYRRESPSHHFSTSAQIPVFAEAITRMVHQVDTALGSPDPFDVVDVGAGNGELLGELARFLPQRFGLTAVDLRPRPANLTRRVSWRSRAPEQIHGLLIACELLDNVPCDIAVVDPAGKVRYEEVDPTGRTRPGPMVAAADAAWLAEWWPIREPGHRAEIGRPRDTAWRDLTARLHRGTALAIDYGHIIAGRPPLGTLTGFQRGRTVAPVPDGSCDVTAHVAVDAVPCDRLLSQRDALRALGVSGAHPHLSEAYRDPTGYATRLARSNSEARLIDPAGLGAHWWMLSGTIPESI